MTPFINRRAVIVLALSASAAPHFAQAQTATSDTDAPSTYIVRLADEPVASYAGGVAGLKATKPASGQLLNVSAADVQAYANYLNAKQLAAAAVAGNVAIAQRYSLTYNGFSAVMTPAQASRLRNTAGVESVSPDRQLELATSRTPAFLGLDKPGGLWPQLGGKGLAGEGMIIGVIDTGASTENPAFADQVDATGAPIVKGGTLAYGPPPARWKGKCETGPGFPATDCNNKLIGARSFRAGMEQALVSRKLVISPNLEYLSPRDSNGHGSHTASTAGGNSDIALVTSGGVDAGKISGMAPRARLAVYKVCWTFAATLNSSFATGNGCYSSDAIAAIEQAVKDGVNVLNFSISGTPGAVDEVDAAFLGAVAANVFVSAAAGNEGPANNVNHAAPWMATVAAASFDRQFRGKLTLGNGAQFDGARFIGNAALPATPVVLGTGASLPPVPGLPPEYLRVGCINLDPVKIKGKVVVCENPGFDTTTTSFVIARMGAAGLIVSYDAPRELTDSNTVIPGIEISPAAMAALKAYVSEAKTAANTSMSLPSPTYGNVTAPVIADFSSRGPNLGDPSVLKPDFAAPGVDVYAAFLETLTKAQLLAVSAGTYTPKATYASMSGTSMSTPHVTGIAALLMQRHPTWSVSAIKSALTTTAYGTRLNPNFAAQDARKGLLAGTSNFAQGAGHVSPTEAADPGLVYDTPIQDYRRYLCTQNHFSCAGLPPLRGTELNQPSIGAEVMVGLPVTVRRSVTNVSAWSSTYQSAVNLPGFDVQVSPSFLTLQPGETKSFTVKLTPTTAEPQLWKFGEMVWDDGSHKVRSPIVVRALLKTAAPPLYTSGVAKAVQIMTVGTATAGPLTTPTTALKQEFFIKSGRGTSKDYTCRDAPEAYSIYHSFMVAPNTKVIAIANTWPKDLPTGTKLPQFIELVSPSQKVMVAMTASGIYHAYIVENPEPGLWKMCAGDEGFAVTAALRVWATPGVNWGLRAMGPAKTFAGGTASVAVSWAAPADPGLYFGWVDFLVGGSITDATPVAITTLPGSVALYKTEGAVPGTVPASKEALVPRPLN